ncbi:MAG: histidinol-phosphatase [Rhizobiaceae bacterium]|jgi:histidinol phosphatase-like enzyme (inositol monophosphatase family)|nr:histidinol-phosphatase [Rhizobiaceae bacterium]
MMFEFLEQVAATAAEATLPHFRSRLAIDNKEAQGFDPVTEADRAAERQIRALIAQRFPEDGIHGEEYGLERPDAPRRWVIDPVDGTRAFITGLPVWGTLVGLTENGRAVAGLMAQPFTGEAFIADGTKAMRLWRGAAEPLGVSGCRDLTDARLFTTSPHLFQGALRQRYDALERDVKLFRYGTDCYAFAMLAAGFADLVIDPGLQAYDIVALIALIEQAGGIVTTLDGGRAENGGDIIAAATPELHASALAVMRG